MRFSLSLLAALSATAAWADTIPVPSAVTTVTMYPDSAAITRTAEFQIPVGKHRLVVQGVPDTASLETLRIDLTGARQIGTVFRAEYALSQKIDDPRLAEAEARVEEIEQRMQMVRDDATRAGLKGEAAEVSIGFLQQLGENEGVAQAAPDVLRDIAQMISAEAESAGQVVLDAEIETRQIERQLLDLEEELATAEQMLEAIDLETEDRLYIAVEVEAAEATSGEIVLNYLDGGESFWAPVYDFRLETGDTPQLTIERGAYLQQETGENWTDVTLFLSTVEPIGQIEPSKLHTQRRRIEEPLPEPPQSEMGAYSEPVVEAPVIIEGSVSRWVSDSDGPGVTYVYGEPVSIASGADILRLELDVLSEAGEITARAVPMRDETAYRVVEFTNSTAEELLSVEYAARYIDGVFIGEQGFEGLAAGEEGEIGFGPIDGLKIRRDVLGQNEGGRGFISRSNEQVQKVEIEVENLTNQAWPLQIHDRVPYTEQEDLKITWSATPHPTEEDLDKRRGILAWDLDIEPGETRKISLETTLSWPEGMELR